MRTAQHRRLCADLTALCHRGLDVESLVRRATTLLRTAIGFDRSCWHTMDPATSMLTGAIKDDFVAEPRFPRYEYSVDDVNKFAFLARRDERAGILSVSTGGFPEQSARYRDLLKPIDIAHELRASFVADESCWGACALYRDRGGSDFTSDDAVLMRDCSSILADGLRRALLVAAIDDVHDSEVGPGLILLDAEDRTVSITPAAERLLDGVLDIGPRAPGQLPSIVYAIAGRARAAVDSASDAGPAKTRVQAAGGDWRVLHGTLLPGQPIGGIGIIVERARQAEIAPLIVEAYGLSPRERRVTQLALLGLGTREIGEKLNISPLTVQDHLKVIFRKVGVHSRKELVARVFVEQYEPRLRSGQTPGAAGFFNASSA